jgi:FAD/FMN-containing dehydrogenase
MSLTGEPAAALWRSIRELTPTVLTTQPDSVVVRVSSLPAGLAQIFQVAGERAVLVRAGVAVGYLYCLDVEDARKCLAEARQMGLAVVVEHAPVGHKRELDSWPGTGSEIELMRLIKLRLDPSLLLNRGRLFDQI